ncbi:MAG: hypothetical protein Q6J44_04125 [Gloeomargarita sp. DG02_4_bins_56]
MFLENDLWEDRRISWQKLFMQNHVLWLGYLAWQGYLRQGRGVLACTVADVIPPLPDWPVKPVNFSCDFIPGAQVVSRLDTPILEAATFAFLAEAVGSYTPERELVMLLRRLADTEIYRLRPKIAPPQCYEQVQKRWPEFQPEG